MFIKPGLASGKERCVRVTSDAYDGIYEKADSKNNTPAHSAQGYCAKSASTFYFVSSMSSMNSGSRGTDLPEMLEAYVPREVLPLTAE